MSPNPDGNIRKHQFDTLIIATTFKHHSQLVSPTLKYGTIDDDETRFKFLDRAYELGATFWDTADVYGDSEDLIGKWFKRTGKRDEIFLVTKAMKARTIDSTPEYCLEACGQSLKKFGVDYIDLYYAHRIDGVTPIEKTMEPEKSSATTIRRTHAIHPLSCVQMEYSPFSMDIESPSTDTLRTCRELRVSIVAQSRIDRRASASRRLRSWRRTVRVSAVCAGELCQESGDGGRPAGGGGEGGRECGTADAGVVVGAGGGHIADSWDEEAANERWRGNG
ncbi:hypothetical protein VC83_04101 [Pseudogymnoascus destructans]|uniref:NADP-dependent oxidoreductase domain-containing protein n=1 Tax=Pseudogymnoascus destructans TaxID=655981 RepID=A0A177AE45_9PEZI|nr:uncharacterized protein VC83_04101 [Pseudogymnoascus destructans]OAF59692.1 hypothetical protein VC83_04101 [Pseudogymnoascus destructans]